MQYPIGHRRRRDEGIPELIKKFMRNLARRFNEPQQLNILDACMDHKRLTSMSVNEFMEMFVI